MSPLTYGGAEMKHDVLRLEICEVCGRSFRYPVKRKGPPRRGAGDNRKLPNWTRKVLPGGRKAYLSDGASEPLEVRRSPGEENWRLYHAGKDTGY